MCLAFGCQDVSPTFQQAFEKLVWVVSYLRITIIFVARSNVVDKITAKKMYNVNVFQKHTRPTVASPCAPFHDMAGTAAAKTTNSFKPQAAFNFVGALMDCRQR